jgi:hypothetical protein
VNEKQIVRLGAGWSIDCGARAERDGILGSRFAEMTRGGRGRLDSRLSLVVRRISSAACMYWPAIFSSLWRLSSVAAARASSEQ